LLCRARRDDASGATKYNWDGLNAILERDGADTTTRTHTHGVTPVAGIGTHLTTRQHGGTPEDLWYQHDAIGSTRQLSDEASPAGLVRRNLLDAWGSVLATDGSKDTPYVFTGKKTDADTGLIYFGRRFYDPVMGRWLNRDPARDGLNWYAYASNNPVGVVDAEGLQGMPIDARAKQWIERELRGAATEARRKADAFLRALPRVRQFDDTLGGPIQIPEFLVCCGDEGNWVAWEAEGEALAAMAKLYLQTGRLSVGRDAYVNRVRKWGGELVSYFRTRNWELSARAYGCFLANAAPHELPAGTRGGPRRVGMDISAKWSEIERYMECLKPGTVSLWGSVLDPAHGRHMVTTPEPPAAHVLAMDMDLAILLGHFSILGDTTLARDRQSTAVTMWLAGSRFDFADKLLPIPVWIGGRPRGWLGVHTRVFTVYERLGAGEFFPIEATHHKVVPPSNLPTWEELQGLP